MFNNISHKQFLFLMEEQRKFLDEKVKAEGVMKKITDGDSDMEQTKRLFEQQFACVCNKMLEHEDKEIKIDLARHLMFKGYREFTNELSDAMRAAHEMISNFE